MTVPAACLPPGPMPGLVLLSRPLPTLVPPADARPLTPTVPNSTVQGDSRSLLLTLGDGHTHWVCSWHTGSSHVSPRFYSYVNSGL